ncbi:hypothetical protein MUN76_15405 [Leucobacter rhizosphaerae]|uniref:Uncharacterized protein n=1 Tax=Leucobacter rhizosphaerae TaxID=2932245 RepID=A0ABY4FVQ3_9MICO|nr:hypothetical protein [Leucobacter rhizosphaerae]UOQ60395.1 hypothetical protein MUN76_15405 [Leucobacter rhizosphaerae]
MGTQDLAGRCLPFAQSFFGAPIRYDYAFQAWEATQHKGGVNDPLPDVPVLLWFSHIGRYYSHSKGVWETVNAGHVTIHVPGDAIYSSPTSGYGSQRFATIREIEQAFNATYVGWSLDINGLLVAAWEEDDDMYSDDDRTRDNQVARDVKGIRETVAEIKETLERFPAVDDAIFKKTKTSFGTPGGLLLQAKRTDDALFKDTETSFGTPGGVLKTLRVVLDKLDEISGGKAGGE